MSTWFYRLLMLAVLSFAFIGNMAQAQTDDSKVLLLTSKLPPCASAVVILTNPSGVSFPTKPDPQKTLSRPEAEKLAACWRKQTFKPFDRDIDGKIYPEYVICFYTGQKKLALKVGINFKAQAIDLMDSDTVATFKAVAS